MARGITSFANNGFLDVKGLARHQAILEALPARLVARLRAVNQAAAERFVGVLHTVLPVNDLDPHPGALRESAHTEAGPTPTSAKVVVDARDEKGRAIAKHVEHGHKARDGSHVAAHPAYYPALREEKKRLRRDLAKALREEVKAAVANAGGAE